MEDKGSKRGPYGKHASKKQCNTSPMSSEFPSHDSVVTQLKGRLVSRKRQIEEIQCAHHHSEETPITVQSVTLDQKTSSFESTTEEMDDEFPVLDGDNCDNVEPEHFLLDIEDDVEPDIRYSADTSDPDGKPLYPGAKVNIGTFMLLIALFVSKHNLSSDAIHQLLQLFNYILPSENSVTTTLHAFKSYFKHLNNPFKYHHYCPKCLNRVNNKVDKQCPNESCQQSFSTSNLPYFVEIPVIEQLKSLFSHVGFFTSLQGRFRRNSTSCADIYDGNIYKTLFENNGPLSEPENISFILNTDGAPVFKSSNVSIWPLFLAINELDLKQRMRPENMILAGLWFGSIKPTMGTFLKPFVDSMKELYSGVKCFSPERGNFICKSFLLAATADLPAKALLCNSVQYNGSFGCWHCLQKGETAVRGKGHVHVFPFISENSKGPARTIQGVLRDAQSVMDTGRFNFNINGIKGPSWLMLCPKFEIVSGMAIDYMHGILLGVQKLLLRLWFTKEFATRPFSVSSKLNDVDLLLTGICPTLDISRIPRSIGNELKYWKASEFQNFLLFYSLPLLFRILDKDRFLHYALFVNAIFVLLKSNVTGPEIDRADLMLIQFCDKFSELYDGCFMTLNVHQLVHLADHVRQLGPLYTFSCFPFENKNGILLKLIKGTQNIDQQIATGVSFIQKLPELKHKFIENESKSSQLCSMIEFPHILKRGRQLMADTYILGGTMVRKLTDHEFDVLCKYLSEVPLQEVFMSFNRLELRGNILYGQEYSRMIKRNNSVIQYLDKNARKFGQIRFFLFLQYCNKTLAVVDTYECLENQLKVDHIFRVKKSNALSIVPIGDIICLNLVVDIKDKGVFVCQFPNKHDFL